MNRFLDKWGTWLLVIGLLSASAILTYFLVMSREAEKKVFMDACMQDRKWYECESMWNASQPKTYIQPAPVIIHR
jgi:uncharacterized membrane protein